VRSARQAPPGRCDAFHVALERLASLGRQSALPASPQVQAGQVGRRSDRPYSSLWLP